MTTGFQQSDRGFLAIGGGDAEKFLQDLVSNDVTRDGLIYAALLTPQGKYLADFFVLREGDGFLLDVPQILLDGLAARLGMYKLRADVVIDKVDRAVWVVIGGQDGYADPRHPALGRRVYGQSGIAGDSDPAAWEAARVEHVIPLAGKELIPNDSYILECGFERIGGVDFRKGCYVGQEVTARMKHKTELRKGMTGVKFGAPGVVEGAEIRREGRPVGRVTSVAGNKGIGYVRFDRVGADMIAGDIAVSLREVPA